MIHKKPNAPGQVKKTSLRIRKDAEFGKVGIPNVFVHAITLVDQFQTFVLREDDGERREMQRWSEADIFH